MVEHKLSLFQTILININIMLGTGIFINTVLLPQHAGFLGFLAYACIAVLLFPLLLTTGALVKEYPDGGFYIYGKNTIGTFAGFISGWIYFMGKLASASLMIHVSVLFLQQIIQPISTIPTLYIDMAIILFFTILNLLNIKTGTRIVMTFVTIKIIMILSTLFIGLYLYNPTTLSPEYFMWSGIPGILPYVLYVFIGFELSCSLSNVIINPKRNAPRALFFSYGLILITTILFQLLLFTSIGPLLMTKSSFLETFPTLFATLFPYKPILAGNLSTTAHIAIASSALGGTYGLFFGNHWNLHTLAQNGHTFFPKLLTYRNSHNIPIAGIIVEGIVCVGYLLLTNGNQPSLQQIGAFGPTIAFTISVIGLLYAQKRGVSFNIHPAIVWLALMSCFLLLGAFINTFRTFGHGIMIHFCGVIIFGIIMYRMTLTHQKSHL